MQAGSSLHSSLYVLQTYNTCYLGTKGVCGCSTHWQNVRSVSSRKHYISRLYLYIFYCCVQRTDSCSRLQLWAVSSGLSVGFVLSTASPVLQGNIVELPRQWSLLPLVDAGRRSSSTRALTAWQHLKQLTSDNQSTGFDGFFCLLTRISRQRLAATCTTISILHTYWLSLEILKLHFIQN